MIYGYPETPSVYAGDTLSLHILHADGRQVYDRYVTRVELSKSWRPGVYVVSLDGRGTTDARFARALFVVRPRRSVAPLLVVLPLFTYHAYNVAAVDPVAADDEGDCLYSGSKRVSLLRPGGGIGGHPWDERNADVYDATSPRQTFAHWDAKALAWLAAHGYAYEVCTDLDLHDGTVDVGRFRAIASFGHHEYWTAAMRERVERYVDEGGNVAFFGGNTMWFRLRYDPHTKSIARDGRWEDEWRLTGVTYACGGGRWKGSRPAAPFVVRDAAHPVYKALNLCNGDTFGDDWNLAGYECDGAPPQSDLEILATASLDSWPEKDECGERANAGHAALGIRRQGRGTVFTASTVDWVRALAGGDRIVNVISHNVLSAFCGEVRAFG